MTLEDGRRSFLTLAGTSLLFAACRRSEKVEAELHPALPPPPAAASGAPKAAEQADDDELSAVEDLMREHGVIRRILVVYREAATRLRLKPASVVSEALHQAALLMQAFGEDYHEKQLEETHIFPALKKAGGQSASLIDTLTAQHQRGREITSYVLQSTRQTLVAANAASLARALEGFARMYEEHAAFEDTLVFPAWKRALSQQALAEMGERFEAIEHQTFGKDGFDDAQQKIAAIETRLGIELAAMLPEAPPTLAK